MDYKKLMQLRNEQNAFGNLVGIKITEMSDKHAVCELEITDDHLNPMGTVHGGVLFTIADIAGGSAAISCNYQVTTMTSDFHFLNAGIGTKKLIAEGSCEKAGHKVQVYRVDVRDQNGTELAFGTFSYMVLPQSIDF